VNVSPPLAAERGLSQGASPLGKIGENGGMKFIMSQKEITRLHVIQSCIDGKLTVRQAAERLRLSPRRVQQLKRKVRLQGAAAVIHGNTGKKSPKAISREQCETILAIRKQDGYSQSNFKHFQELLKRQFKIEIPYSTLYQILTQNNIQSPKTRRKRKKTLHPTRERKPAAGMMLQADATPFEWLGGNKKYALHGFIDDATGTVTGLFLCENECLLGYLEVLRQTLTTYGIPQSLYPDRYSVFFVNPKKDTALSIDEQLAGVEKRVTQFGRIIDRLGIDMFPAHSPQAKGRIERLWNTLQSRLPIELKLRNIMTMEEANRFLKHYLQNFNRQFARQTKETYSAYVPVPHTVIWIDCCVQSTNENFPQDPPFLSKVLANEC
jgi:transposase